jgi:UPF0716 protein FxsA
LLARLFVLFALLPIVEIVLLVWIASRTSILLVLGLVVGVAVVGAWLARRQGVLALSRITADMQAGRAPADAMLDGLLIFMAAVLLILPGFLSDVLALVLLVPASRRVVKSLLRRRMQGRVVTTGFASFEGASRRDEVIDVRVIESPPRELPD